MSDIAEASVTLPEGATVTVVKSSRANTKTGSGSTSTALYAQRGEIEIRMRVDDVSAQNIKSYLDLVCREIARRRKDMAVKPEMCAVVKPENFDEFVQLMAKNDMFIFEAIKADDNYNGETGHTSAEKPKRKKKAAPKKKSSVSVDEIKKVFPDATIIEGGLN